jgi:hypothetical protein
VAEGDPELLQVGVRQLGQHLGVEVILAERLLVPFEPETLEPSRDVHVAPVSAVSATYTNPRRNVQRHVTSERRGAAA